MIGTPPSDDSHFFWRHAFSGGVLYVHAADVTEFMRRWAEKFDALGVEGVGDDVRSTADELDAEWIGFTTEKRP